MRNYVASNIVTDSAITVTKTIATPVVTSGIVTTPTVTSIIVATPHATLSATIAEIDDSRSNCSIDDGLRE